MNWIKACVSDANCVEVAADGGRVLLRDSKQPDGPVVELSPDQWDAFRRMALTWRRGGSIARVLLDGVTFMLLPSLEDGVAVWVRYPPGSVGRLHFTTAEWDAFVASLRAGQFDELVTG